MGRKIIDCDNTFGVDGCDVDDGLAIIYTLAQKRCGSFRYKYDLW